MARRKKQTDPTVPIVSMTIVAVVVLGICMVLVVAMDDGNETSTVEPPKTVAEGEPHLLVENMYFQLMGDPTRAYEGETSNVQLQTILTNNGRGAARNVTIWAKALETRSNMVMSSTDGTIADMAVNTTVQKPLDLELRNGESYRIEIMIIEDGMLRVEGSGALTLGGGKSSGSAYDDDGAAAENDPRFSYVNNDEGDGYWGDDDDCTGDSCDEDDESMSEGGSAALAGLGILMLLVVILAMAMVARHRGKKNAPGPQPHPDKGASVEVTPLNANGTNGQGAVNGQPPVAGRSPPQF